MYASNMHLLTQNEGLDGSKHYEIDRNTLSIDLPHKSLTKSMVISNAHAYKYIHRCIHLYIKIF